MLPMPVSFANLARRLDRRRLAPGARRGLNRRIPPLLLLLVIGTGSTLAQAQSPARMSIRPEDAAWIDGVLQAWELSQQEILKIASKDDRVEFVFFDSECVYRGTSSVAPHCERHADTVRLPDGKSIPAQVTSFAAPFDDNKRVFMAMALPEIWRQGGVQSELGLETLMSAVFLHEMAHTRQFRTFLPMIERVASRFDVGDKINDDIVQERFSDDARFVASINQERDLLFASASSSNTAEARNRARQALAMINDRRARFYIGEHEALRELEDIFITLEGVAQWTSLQWLMHPRGVRLDRQAALAGLRRDGRKWSQDEGLAMFLVIDRFVPDWKERVFGDHPPTALQLLAEATR
jgi:hypothetical protein